MSVITCYVTNTPEVSKLKWQLFYLLTVLWVSRWAELGHLVLGWPFLGVTHEATVTGAPLGLGSPGQPHRHGWWLLVAVGWTMC